MSDTEDTRTLSREEVVERLLAVIDAHPDNINPTNEDGGCVYTAVGQPRHHCLIGQMATDLGWKMPAPGDTTPAGEAAKREGWPVEPSAVGALDFAQRAADEATWSGGSWSAIRSKVAALAEVAG